MGSFYDTGFRAIGLQPHRSGVYYTSQIGTSTSSAAPTQSNWLAMPFWVPNSGSYDRIGAEVTTTAASGVVRLGIVSDTGSMYPDSLVLDAGTIDGSSGTGFKEITIDQYLTAGLYWLTACSQTAAPTMRLFNLGSSIIGTSAPSSSAIVIAYQQASVTGAFPASFSPSGVATSATRVYVRRA